MDSNQATNETAALGLLTLASNANHGHGHGQTKSGALMANFSTANAATTRPPSTQASVRGTYITISSSNTTEKKKISPLKDLDENPGTIANPSPHDILSGRGNGANQHPGNIFFRSLVNKFKRRYVLSEPANKKQITRQILGTIQGRNPPGRFLKQNSANELWHELGREHALKKTAQALREKAPELKKKVGLGLLEDAAHANSLISSTGLEAAATLIEAQEILNHDHGLAEHENNDKGMSKRTSITSQQLQASYISPTNPVVLSRAQNDAFLPPPSVNFHIPGPSNQSAENGLRMGIVEAENHVLTTTNSNVRATGDRNCVIQDLFSHTSRRKEIATPLPDMTAQFPERDLPYAFNYKTVSILSAKMTDVCEDGKRRNINCDDDNETLKNITTVASTNCDLTALYLIVRMSSKSFRGFGKIVIVPKESDVLIDGVTNPNNQGNIKLADAIQGYRTEYMSDNKAEARANIEKQIYACIVTKNPSNSNPPGNFIQRGKDSKWRKLNTKEAIVVVRSLLEQACSYILNPDIKDILFDGDLKSQSSLGTIFFNTVIQRSRHQFLQYPSEKRTHFVAEIVGFATNRPARFLGYIPHMAMWMLLSFDAAMKKTREALLDDSVAMTLRNKQRLQAPEPQPQEPQSHIFDNELTQATNHAVQIHSRRSTSFNQGKSTTARNQN